MDNRPPSSLTHDPFPVSRFLSIQSAYGPTFSPDGQRLAFLSNITGLPQVWAMAAAGGWPDPLTFDDDRVVSVAWSPIDEALIFARDLGGNENARLFWVRADGTGERRLTGDDGAMHILGAWSPDGQTIAYAANRRDRSRCDVWVQDLATGREHLAWQNEAPGFLQPVAFAPDSQPGAARLLVMLLHSTPSEDLYELSLPGDGPAAVRHLTPHTGEVRFSFPAYAASGRSIYCLCDVGRDWRGVARLELPDLAQHWIATPEVEIDDLAVSPDGRWLAWAENHSGAHAIVALDLSSGQTVHAPGLPLGALFPPPSGSDQGSLTFSPDGQQLAITFSTPTRTADIWTWRLAEGRLAPITHGSHAGVPAHRLSEPELVHYPTFDGRQIPAWSYRVPADPGERRPVVVYVHGGPEGQTKAFLIPIVQYLLNCGFHVLAPNVRGSSGYGKTYLSLDVSRQCIVDSGQY